MSTQPSTADLAAHRERNSSDPEGLLAAIQDSRVEYVYYQVVTITGRVLGKVVPARHLIRNVERGVQMHRTAMSDLQVNRAGELLGGGAEAAEYTAMPDLDSFAVLPWDASVGRFFCQLYEPAHRPGIGGQALATDVRGNLKRVHADFTERTGLVLRSGCEPEMTWRGTGLDAQFRPDSSPAYHVEHLERHRPIYQKVITYAQALGLDMIEGDYEDPGQLELNWMYDHADLTADRLITYRQICKQVARELGIQASFMPKPATGMMGNGCHHNLSLWRGDDNILEDPSRVELHLTDEGRYALGGLLSHAAGSMAIMGSTVNSYKRYWDSGMFAPSQINWGLDNKTCTVRLSANGRLEFKLPDSLVNPYLSHAVLIAALSDGLTNKIDPGPSQEGSSYNAAAVRFAKLPLTLGEALEAFSVDPVVKDALGPDLVELYTAYKSDEWARFCGAVTDWEHRMYTEAAP